MSRRLIQTTEIKKYQQMEKCCTSKPIYRNLRRSNGLQLPLHVQQIIGWVVLVATAIINLAIFPQIQSQELEIPTIVIYIILYVTHIVSHATATVIDPAEKDLRKRINHEVPEFDRNIHAHVIEDGRCHLCNIFTSNMQTKHCSLCNKCVIHFDHHCNWLNNCIGQRNYVAFIGSVVSALFISSFTSTLCIVDIVGVVANPHLLSPAAQNFINCTSNDFSYNYVLFCWSSICFIIFLVILGISGIAITCALLHLCCFHVYIYLLGISTYEYIMRYRIYRPRIFGLCSMNLLGKCSYNKKKMISHIMKNSDSELYSVSIKSDEPKLPRKRAASIANLLSILNENKVHPHKNKDANSI